MFFRRMVGRVFQTTREKHVLQQRTLAVGLYGLVVALEHFLQFGNQRATTACRHGVDDMGCGGRGG